MIKTFILKHKIGMLSLIFFMAATILFILFVINDLPYYESLTELNASYFLWIGMTVLCLGIANYLTILTTPHKRINTKSKLVLSISTLFILISVTFIMFEFLMAHIDLPPLGDQPTLTETWEYYDAKIQIYDHAKRVGSYGDVSLIIGLIVAIIGRSIFKVESEKEFQSLNDEVQM